MPQGAPDCGTGVVSLDRRFSPETVPDWAVGVGVGVGDGIEVEVGGTGVAV